MAKVSQQKPYPSIRIFKHDWMERFTHIHPLLPIAVWGPIIAYMLWQSFDALHPLIVFGVGLVGFASWTLVEYLLHRFVFHFPAEGPFQERLLYLLHGIHHSDPVDPTRLVMPPVLSLLLGAMIYLIFRMIIGPEYITPFYAFFVIGYLCYDYTHYAVHHFNFKSRYFKTIKQNHMLHHYVTPNARWGVSSPLWDHLFGSMEEEKRKERAAT